MQRCFWGTQWLAFGSGIRLPFVIKRGYEVAGVMAINQDMLPGTDHVLQTPPHCTPAELPVIGPMGSLGIGSRTAG